MLSQRIERLKRRALEEPSPNGSWMPHGSWMSPFPDFRRTAEVCRIFAEKGAVRIAADELIVGTIPLVSRDEEEKARAKSVSEPPWEPSEEARRLEAGKLELLFCDESVLQLDSGRGRYRNFHFERAESEQ